MRAVQLVILFLLSTTVIHLQGQIRGTATYYGRQSHGMFTASGERLNMNDFVAAHKSLPFGTHIKVKNVKNNKVIIIRVVDRCSRRKPWAFVDLSYSAAKQLDMLFAGRAFVTLEILDSAKLAKNKDILDRQLQLKIHGEMLDSLENSSRESLLKNVDTTTIKYGVLVGTTTNKAGSYQSARRFSIIYKCKTSVVPKYFRNKTYFQIIVIGFASLEDANQYSIEITKKIRGAKVIKYKK